MSVAIKQDSICMLSGQNGYTAKILDALGRAKHEFVYIGFLLCEVESFGIYREGGFSDIYDYCEVAFGFKRSSTNNFMRIYRKFGEAMGLVERYRNFSYSQLTEMCSMTDGQLAKCHPEMSVKQLKEIKRSVPSHMNVISISDPVQTSGLKEFTVSEELAKRLREVGFTTSAQISSFLIQCLDRFPVTPVCLTPDLEISDMGYCSNCNHLCAFDDSFCSTCGSVITAEEGR